MALRLLAVHAHPDDESSKGAATCAAYVARGAEVMVVSCTGGEAGDILNERFDAVAHANRDMGGRRRYEMAAARDALGIQHRWLGYADSGMPEDGAVAKSSFAGLPAELTARPLIRIVREFRPHVIVTYDENGGYPHPDHIRTHDVSMIAWREAGSDAHPELGEPWTPLKLYYDRTMNAQRAERLLEGARHLPAETDPALVSGLEQMLDWMRRKQSTITTSIDIADHLEARDAALRAHSSQIAPDSGFFALPRDLERTVYPYDDFELVDSRVEAATPETDLFAGISEEAAA